MFSIKTSAKWATVLLSLVALAGCGGSDSDDAVAAISSITISGTMGSDTMAAFTKHEAPTDTAALQRLLNQYKPFARTACGDGSFYDVYCLSFQDTPVAGIGDVDCAGSGAFSIAGMPINVPIGCFVRRYTTAEAAAGAGETVGTISVPATNFAGESNNLTPSSDIVMTVTLGTDGGVSAVITAGTADTTGAGADSGIVAATFNGVYSLTCDSSAGGTNFSQGHCKCFLTDNYPANTYNNQEECMADANGAGALLTGAAGIGIGLYLNTATANSDIPIDDSDATRVIPAGTTVQAISIWGATGSVGSYVSARTGGEGVTDLGGALTWTNAEATTAIDWTDNTSGTVTASGTTFTMPAMPANPNTANHGAWVTWAQAVANAAGTAGFTCSRKPQGTAASGATIESVVSCVNEVLESLRDAADMNGYVVPRIYLMQYCDQTGCHETELAADSALSGAYNANAFQHAHVELEGGRLSYPNSWDGTTDLSSTAPGTDSIGLGPGLRYLFEPFTPFATGGGSTQQRHGRQEQRECVASSAGSYQVANAACTGSGYFEIVCHQREELSLTFLPVAGTSNYNVLFDQNQVVGYAEVRNWNGSSSTPVTPTGTTALEMCNNIVGGGGGTFMARAVKE